MSNPRRRSAQPESAALSLRPITLREASAFIARHHRHHGPPRGHRFSLAVAIGERVVGVAVLGRPVARRLDDGWSLEVIRCCTDGTPNVCSKLLASARRAAQALGYRRLVTYTLAAEPGTSLKAAGWRVTGHSPGGSWSRRDRRRSDARATGPKRRWEPPAALSKPADGTGGCSAAS